jgi:hypothetical protein
MEITTHPAIIVSARDLERREAALDTERSHRFLV